MGAESSLSTKLFCFTSKGISLAKKAVGDSQNPSVEKGEAGCADWVIVGLHGLREYLDPQYRRLPDILHEMPRIVKKFGLAFAELPDFTTVCTPKQDLKMRTWRVLRRFSAQLQERRDVQAIDAAGFDRIAASHHYANRTNYTFRSVKTTVLIDCHSGLILDIHCSMKQPHDTQIGWQVLKRNLHRVETLTADNGYDWDEFRRNLRNEGVRPVIKYREFCSLGARTVTSPRATLSDVRVPNQQRIGEVGEAYVQRKRLRTGVNVPARGVGIARAALDDTVAYTDQREQFDHPIGDFQGVKWEIAEMAQRVDTARLLTLRAADRVDRGYDTTREFSMAKVVATQAAVDNANKAMQLHGGIGYTTETHVERYLRDARLLTIAGGPNEGH